MPNITNTVGHEGKNLVHDVAMVQFMLKVLKTSLRAPYFNNSYTNRFGADTVAAITSFQRANGLAATTPPGTGGGGPAKPGIIEPGGATWQKLVSAFNTVEAPYRTARVTPGFSLVYVPMTAGQKLAAVTGIRDAENLQNDFREKVMKLVEGVYASSGIAWSLVPRTGAFRSFEGQANLNTDAGFGESIHHYGYAVDLTVGQFSWFGPDAKVRTSEISLKGMDSMNQIQLFNERDKLAKELMLFNTTKAGDRYHLQNFDDEPLDSVSSLMALMHAYGPRKMKWEPRYRKPTDYLCDLGLGGALYFVGTSVDIWNEGDRHISAADLASALNAKKATDPKFSVETFLGRTPASPVPGKAADPKPTELKTADIKPSDIKAVQRMLKEEFRAASRNWDKWKPVNYPNADRRPENPVKR